MTAVAARAVVVAEAAERPTDVLVRLLDDLAGVVLTLDAETYGTTPFPGVSGSIGEHVRHVLDHVAAFVAARGHGTLTYDRRERGTAVETDRGAALRAMLRLKALLDGMSDERLDSPVAVTALLARGREPETSWSTLRRELAFVISHTVHHQALIATLLAAAGTPAPDTFGVAASTPKRPPQC